MGFEVRKVINLPALGEWFSKERESRGWTLAKAGRETNVSKDIIAAMEREEWGKLPAGPLRKKFILSYARALGASPSIELAAETAANKSLAGSIPLRTHPIKPERVFTRTHLTLLVLGLIGLAILAYLGFEIRNLHIPPPLAVTTPTEGAVSNHPIIIVEGATDPRAEVKINGEIAENTGDGKFSARIDLARGANIIEITSRRGHSREAKIYRTVLFE